MPIYLTLALAAAAISYAVYEIINDHGRYNTETVWEETGEYYDEFMDRYRITGIMVAVAAVLYANLASDWYSFMTGLSLLLILFLLDWRILSWYYIRKNKIRKSSLGDKQAL